MATECDISKAILDSGTSDVEGDYPDHQNIKLYEESSDASCRPRTPDDVTIDTRRDKKLIDKQEARKVCKSISRLLRDRQSKTRGTRMFQKRRRRSEKFAIVGYGTQPVEDSGSEDQREDSESVFLTSTDDEIAAYDHPGPDNLLEQDENLTIAEQLAQRQQRNLAMDAANMKGKGAKLFARRQRRMEKFVVQGTGEAEPVSSVPNGADNSAQPTHPSSRENQPLSQAEEKRADHTPVSFGSMHRMQNGGQVGAAASAVTTNGCELLTSDCQEVAGRRRRTRPSDRLPWKEGDERPARFASADWSTDDDDEERLAKQTAVGRARTCAPVDNQVQRSRFRSVRPPTGQSPMPFHDPHHVNVTSYQALTHSDKGNVLAQLENSDSLPFYAKPARTWSSVKFQPKSTSGTERNKIDQSYNNVAHPFASSKAVATTLPAASNVNWKPPPKWQPSQHTVPLKLDKQPQLTSRQPSPSIALLREPVSMRSPSPYQRFEPVSPYPPNATAPAFTCTSQSNGAANSFGRTQTSNQPKLSSATTYNGPENSFTHCFAPTKPINPAITKPNSTSTNQTHQQPYRPHTTSAENSKPEDKKVKVAACLRLLDPSKGQYEPKLELVYKQSPSLGAMIDEENRSAVAERPPSRSSFTPQQFNKPVRLNDSIPQSSYLRDAVIEEDKARQNQAPALGSIAGELKGKGARMFEKQQKRMDRFTKESNGTKEPVMMQSVASGGRSGENGHSRQTVPDRSSRSRMNDVMGEFRKISDSDSPRPSNTRKGRSKDPFHYHQYYVMRRPPSAADFVTVDDAASDSNSSVTSSMTSSYDKTSTSSSGKQAENHNEEDVFVENNSSVTSPKGPPPKVMPKPSLSRFLSAESNPTCMVPSEKKEEVCENADEEDNTARCEDNYQPHRQIVEQITDEKASAENVERIEHAPISETTAPGTRHVSYSVWSPGQKHSAPISFDHLPPPPTYKEVMSPSKVAAKPKFFAKTTPYETFSPSKSQGSVEEATQPVEPLTPAPLSYSAPKPKFVTNAMPAKWVPSSG